MSRQNLKHMGFSQNTEELPSIPNNRQTADLVGHHELRRILDRCLYVDEHRRA